MGQVVKFDIEGIKKETVKSWIDKFFKCVEVEDSKKEIVYHDEAQGEIVCKLTEDEAKEAEEINGIIASTDELVDKMMELKREIDAKIEIADGRSDLFWERLSKRCPGVARLGNSAGVHIDNTNKCIRLGVLDFEDK